ncbi:MAG: hypothetical protein KGH71_01680 [Candidatus Micrarchaeota archaeon]|nr:hypothetical protein [Candidatus Micrarchaeota archaeon]
MVKVKLGIDKAKAIEIASVELQRAGDVLELGKKVKKDALEIYHKNKNDTDRTVRITKNYYSIGEPGTSILDCKYVTSNPEVEPNYHLRVGLVLAGSALYLSCLINQTPIGTNSIERAFKKLYPSDLTHKDMKVDTFMSQKILDTSIFMMKSGNVEITSAIDFVDLHIRVLMNNLAHRLHPDQAERIAQDARRVVGEMQRKLTLSTSGSVLTKQHLAMAATSIYIALKNENERIGHEELGEELGITHGPGLSLYNNCVYAGIVDVTALNTIFIKMRRASRELGLSLETEEKAKQMLKKASGIEMLNKYNPRKHAEMDKAAEAAIWMAALDENKKLSIGEIGKALRNRSDSDKPTHM